LKNLEKEKKETEEFFTIIERKTMKDLISSVNDGRYREQKKRLLETGLSGNRIIYLLEGSMNDIPGNMKTLFGMIINTLFRDNITVLRLESIEDTIYFIKRLIEKLKSDEQPIFLKNFNKNFNSQNLNSIKDNLEQDNLENSNQNNQNNNLEYLSTIKLKKKENLTSNNCSILQLTQIPGMSISNSQIIIDKYKSIANLINSYYQLEENKRILMLADTEILISNNKKRKLGKVLSERIYQYLFNISS
jgi:crossover junction endonuclease MUS81